MVNRESVLPGLFGQPDVSKTHIVFVTAGDLWLVEKEGGHARRLTSAEGLESFPRFSPCGKHVAFSADYTGNRDLYTIPVTGGVPKRLTFHPAADTLIDWHPDGDRLLFASRRETYNPLHSELFEVPSGGGPVTRLGIPFAADGTYSRARSGDRFLVFQMLGRDFSLWRGYQGGLPGGLFVYDTAEKRISRLTDPGGIDAAPMWHGGDLYLISDRPAKEETEETPPTRHPRRVFNLWVIRGLEGSLAEGSPLPKDRVPRQLTRGDDDICFPAMGPSDLVFARAGKIHRIPLDRKPRKFKDPPTVEIDLIPNRAALIPGWQPVDDRIQSFDLSPDGSRLLVCARGSMFVMPIAGGPTRRVQRPGHSPEATERSAAWVGEEHILFHSDAGSEVAGKAGEYGLVFQDLAGRTQAREAKFEDGFRYRVAVDPSLRRAAFFDQTNRLRIADLGRVDGKGKLILKPFGTAERLTPWDLKKILPSWSPNGRLVVFHDSGPNGQSRLKAVDVDSSEIRALTSGFFSDSDPVFDPSGTYLYFVTRRGLNMLRSELGGGSAAYYDTNRLARVKLGHPQETSVDGAPPEANTPSLDKVFGPIESFEGRSELLALPPRQVKRIVPIGAEHLVIDSEFAAKGSRTLSLLEASSAEPRPLIENPQDFAVSGDGSALVVLKEKKLWFIDLEKARLGSVDPQAIDTAGLAKVVDRRAEWHQLFREAWRLVRDYYHDTQRLDDIAWPKLFEKYEERATSAATRDEVNHVINELYAEVGTSHTRVAGGDIESVDEVKVGLLGADLVLDTGRRAFRVERILDTGPYKPEMVSPLIAAGVQAGDYLTAVDYQELAHDVEPWAAFLGKAGRPVSLTVRDSSCSQATEKQITVKALGTAEESLLRLLAWIERNRQQVERESKGHLGYVCIPNTEWRGKTLGEGRHLFERQLRAQSHRTGIVFDVRFNPGGPLPFDLIEEMQRSSLDTLANRFGLVGGGQPVPSSVPHRVLLINGWSGSAAELLAFFFLQGGLGPLLGTRTFGGTDYSLYSPQLIDGGRTSQANTVHLDPLSLQPLGIEGRGVEPCRPEAEDLNALIDGRDNQLEAAVQYLLPRVATNPR